MTHWFTKFFSVNSAFKMNNGRLRPKVRKKLYILSCSCISRKTTESIGLMETSASFLPASKQFCLEMVIWEKMFVKWIWFLLAGVEMFSPFHMQMMTQAIHLVQPGLRAPILLKLLWCSSAIRDSNTGDRPCITAVPFSFGVFCLTEPRFLLWFDHGFFGLVWSFCGFCFS